MVYDAGTALLSIVPSFRGVESAIRAEAARWGTSAGNTFARGFNDRVRDQTRNTPLGPSGAPARRRGQESGGSFADGFKRRLEAALKSLPPVTIGVARNEAEQALRDLQLQLRALGDKRIGIDIDATAAAAEAQRIEQRLNELARSSPDIQVRADTAAAAAQLAIIAAQVDRLSRNDADVDVNVHTAGAMARLAALGVAAAAAGGGINFVGAAGASLAPLIVPAAAAAVAAIAAIGPAAIGGGAGIAVAALGFQGISEAVKALGTAQNDAGKSAGQLAQRQSQVASAADQVTSAERSLANTRTQNAEAERRALAQVADAERAVARAQGDRRQATLDLTRAIEQERRANQDLAFDVEGGALAQRRADMDAAAAKRELDAVLANPKATKAQRDAAQLTYDEITLRVRELAVQQQRLVAEQQKSARVGVEGSDRVQAAQQRVRDTTQGVADAQRALGEAVRAQSMQQTQAAFALAGAQQSVISAQRSLHDATVSAGTAGSASMDKLKESMAALSPAGQTFAKFLFGLKGEFRSLQGAAAAGMLPGVQAAIEKLLPYLPQVERFIGGIGKTMGDLAIKAANALTGPGWEKFFGFIDRTAGPALEQMLTGAGNLALGFGNLLVAFEPLSKDMGAGLLDLTKRFADWTAGLGNSKGFQDFLGYVREFGPMFIKFLGDAFVIVGKLLIALAPLGAVMLTALGWLADFLAGLDPGVLLYIAGAITAIVGGIMMLALGPVAAIGTLVVAVVAIVGAVIYAYQKVAWFRTVVDAVFGAIAAAALWLWNVVLKPTFSALVWLWQNVLAPAAVWLWQNVLKPAFDGISAVVSWAWNNVLKPAFDGIVWVIQNVLGPLFMWLYNNVIKPVWTGIQIAISVAWAIIKVIFGLIQIYIKVIIAPLFMWLYNNIIKPVWNGIKTTIFAVWHFGIKPIFEALGGFIKDHVAPAFKRGVDAVGKAWDGLKAAAKVPVKFVLETILNNGLLAGYNRIAKVFGVKPDDVKIPLPKGFADGGILPGYTPGRDVHRFVSPTGGVLDLSGGEPILRPEAGLALGRGWVNGVNSAARSGGVSGVNRFLGGYADGGILGDIGGAFGAARKKAAGVISGVTDFLSNPGGTLRKLADRLMATMPGRDTMFGKGILGIPAKAAGFLIDKVKNLFGGASGGPTGAGPGFSPWPSSPGAQRGDSGVWRSILNLVRGAEIPFQFGNAYRGGDPLWHGSGRAVDFMGYNQDRLASFFMNMRPRVLELIHTTGQGGYYITRGQRQSSMGVQNELHRNHLHVAMNQGGIMPTVYDSGGQLPPGLSAVYNGTRKPEAVLTHAESLTLQALARGRGGGGDTNISYAVANTTLTPQWVRAQQDRADALALQGRQI